MKYSPGNHRRGTGRRKVSSHGTPTPLSPEKHLDFLEHQILSAEKAGLNSQIYATKKEELLNRYPHLRGK